MKDAVADSSLALKWVIGEDDSDLALALRSHYRFRAPDLIHAECANALWKLVSRNEIPSRAASVAIRAIQADPMEIVATRSLMEDALRLAIELKHPAYDCLFAALAHRESCPMITADKTFARKMEGHAIAVLDMEAALAAAQA